MAGARDCKAADYPREVSACEGQELGGAKAPLAPPPSTSIALAFSVISNVVDRQTDRLIITHVCMHAGQ